MSFSTWGPWPRTSFPTGDSNRRLTGLSTAGLNVSFHLSSTFLLCVSAVWTPRESPLLVLLPPASVSLVAKFILFLWDVCQLSPLVLTFSDICPNTPQALSFLFLYHIRILNIVVVNIVNFDVSHQTLWTFWGWRLFPIRKSLCLACNYCHYIIYFV